MPESFLNKWYYVSFDGPIEIYGLQRPEKLKLMPLIHTPKTE